MTPPTNPSKPVEVIQEDDCPYCSGVEEVEARLADGSSDYVPCPHPCHRLSQPPVDQSGLREDKPGEFKWLAGQLKDQADFTVPHNPDDILYRASAILSALSAMPAQVDQVEVERLKAQLTDSRELVAKMSAQIGKLSGAVEAKPPIGLEAGSWWYPEDDTSSDECRFSAGEVVDYAVEGMDEGESRVVIIQRALQLPDVYAAVHVFTEAEKDARGEDDDSAFTLHRTADEASAAMIAASPSIAGRGEA